MFSPAYSVPPISTSFSSKFIAITVSVLQPCFLGIAWKLGIFIMVKSLTKFSSFDISGLINRCLINKLCQTSSEITRTFILFLGSAPAYKSCINKSLSAINSNISLYRFTKNSASILELFSHQISLSLDFERTMYLSLGDLPVNLPVVTSSVPPKPSVPSERSSDASRSSLSFKL